MQAKSEHLSTLRSFIWNDPIVLRKSTKGGERAFGVTEPSAWNRLPDDVRQSNSLLFADLQSSKGK